MRALRAIVYNHSEVSVARLELRLLRALAARSPAGPAWIRRRNPPDSATKRIADARRAFR